MSYFTLAGTAYGVAIDSARGRRIQIENRTPVLDGSLNVDRIATRREITREIIKDASGNPLTITAANTLIGVLEAGDVAVAGDGDAFTAAAKDIGHRDLIIEGVKCRWVTVTLEEV